MFAFFEGVDGGGGEAAFANPEPEIDPAEAQQYAEVVATGRSDFPNQINNVLASPGGVPWPAGCPLDRHHVVDADRRGPGTGLGGRRDELNTTYITPSVFHADVHRRGAQAVRVAAGGPAELPTVTEGLA